MRNKLPEHAVVTLPGRRTSYVSSDVGFVGADNYARILTGGGLDTQDFGTALRNNFYYVLLVVPLQTALSRRDSFDPLTSQRTFNLAMTDIGEIYFLPTLMERLRQQAPQQVVRGAGRDQHVPARVVVHPRLGDPVAVGTYPAVVVAREAGAGERTRLCLALRRDAGDGLN